MINVIGNIFLIVLGIALGAVIFFTGYELGHYMNLKEQADEIAKTAKHAARTYDEIKEIEKVFVNDDDFPRSVDGKFYSREAAIRNMSLEDDD